MKIVIALLCTTLISVTLAGQHGGGGSSNHIQIKGGIGNGYIYPLSSSHGHSQHGHSQQGHSPHGHPQHGPSQHGHYQHGHSQQGHSQHGSSQHGNSRHGPSQHGNFQHGQSSTSNHHQHHSHSQNRGYSAAKPSYKIYKIVFENSSIGSQFDSGNGHQQPAGKTIRVLHKNNPHQGSHNANVQTIKLIHVQGNSAAHESPLQGQSYGSNIPATPTTSKGWQ